MSDIIVIKKEIEFDAGHRIPNHNSVCRNIHGHRYKAILHISGQLITEEGSSSEGMVLDFSDIKKIAKTFIDSELDHGFIVYKKDIDTLNFLVSKDFKYIAVDFIPTAENLAKYLFYNLSNLFNKFDNRVELIKVELYETPTSSAEYKNPMYKTFNK